MSIFPLKKRKWWHLAIDFIYSHNIPSKRISLIKICLYIVREGKITGCLTDLCSILFFYSSFSYLYTVRHCSFSPPNLGPESLSGQQVDKVNHTQSGILSHASRFPWSLPGQESDWWTLFKLKATCAYQKWSQYPYDNKCLYMNNVCIRNSLSVSQVIWQRVYAQILILLFTLKLWDSFDYVFHSFHIMI